jgi:cation transport ATPase
MTTILHASPHNQRRQNSIPSILAYAAGSTFTLASAATNLTYALGKSDALAQQTIWGVVAVAASFVLALAPSAFVSSLSSKRFGAATLALLAALIFGAYSVAAALGSATGRTPGCGKRGDGHGAGPLSIITVRTCGGSILTTTSWAASHIPPRHHH